MDGIVTSKEFLLGHAEWDTADVLDEQADQAGDDDIPSDNEAEGGELFADLCAVTSDGTTGGDGGEGQAALCGSEDSDKETTDETGDQMGVEDAQDVIDLLEELDFLAENVHGEPWNGSGEDTNDDGTPTSDET